MNAEFEDISQNAEASPKPDPLRAVVFGSQVKLVKQMTEQLSRKKFLAWGITDEKDLLAALSKHDPDMIFLEINGVTRSPIEEIVKVVFLWIKNYARKINAALESPTSRLWEKAQVILYKSEMNEDALNPAGPMIPDLDEVLFKCRDVGAVTYIGLYSAWSFYSKLEPLLGKMR